MHAMWRDGTFYVGNPQQTDAERDAALAVKERRTARRDS